MVIISDSFLMEERFYHSALPSDKGLNRIYALACLGDGRVDPDGSVENRARLPVRDGFYSIRTGISWT